VITKIDAINFLRPGSIWVLRGDDLEWLDTNTTAPTEAEINAEIARLQAEYEAKEYQRQRAAAYPSIVDQLDTLYHQGYDGWKATIEAVKTEFPKP
jgi:phosphoglycolate phosphatase-like HAD superfamily hydrolase